jgi:hypothetical protein
MSKIFAAKYRDEMLIFVCVGETGFRQCEPCDMDTWATLYNAQSETVTLSALIGAAFGWHAPGAQLAVQLSVAPERNCQRSLDG